MSTMLFLHQPGATGFGLVHKDVNRKQQEATVSTSVTAMFYCKLKTGWKAVARCGRQHAHTLFLYFGGRQEIATYEEACLDTMAERDGVET